MGLFDTFHVKYKLPNGKADFYQQTKDYDCLMDTVTIEADGTMTRDYGKNSEESEKAFKAAVDLDRKPKLSLMEKIAAQNLLVWEPDVKRVDFTGSICIDGFCLVFSRGKLDSVSTSPVPNYTPFNAPVFECEAEND